VSLLLDTHVILWWLIDDPALPEELKARLDDEPDVHVSPASIWEVAIKQSIGKITGPDDLIEQMAASDFRPLPITFTHAAAAGRLPPIHGDPFDRMLIAQALCENLTLVTHDALIQKYDVDLLRV
jgi:PIN domain nuclease of toxin-antitoxin system